MNKKGQGSISINTIIVAIVGIIVLLLIVTFFTGGMSTLFNRIRGVFSGGTAGYDIDLAKANCQAYCERAKLLDTDDAKSKSTYCTQKFDIVKVQGQNAVPVYCNQDPISVVCPGIDVGNCQRSPT